VRNSPSKLVPQLKLSSSGCQIIVAVAENDSPEFRKQSEEYCKVSASEHEHYFDLAYPMHLFFFNRFSSQGLISV